MAGIIAPFEKVVGESAQTTARITRIRFVSPDKTYAVVDAVTRKRMSFTMVGSLASFKVDDEVRVKGVWMASKYGTQLRVSSCEIVLPTSSVGLARFLSSQLTGIGLRMAERIIDHFGENTIDILDNNPDRLREVKGISQGKLESIRKEWAEQQQTRQIFVYLQGHGLSYDLSARLIGIYGKKIIAILKQQPYLLAREINGIGFKRADQIASQMGIAPDSPMRIEAGIDYALYEAENCEGHCYLPLPVLVDHAASLLQIAPESVEPHIAPLIDRRNIRLDKDDNGETLIYRSYMWNLEHGVAREIARMVTSRIEDVDRRRDEAEIRRIETSLGIVLADQQRDAVMTSLTRKFLVITGGPGTGKTTLIRMIMGEKEPTDGHITLGSRVHIGYFAQEHTDLHGAWTVLDEIMNDFSYGEEEARSVLGRFMFRGDDVFKVIDSLSGGEQARLALLKLFLQGPNFLILDEPTNHLDIPTREVLEQALLDFGGTYLVVSHDRYFLDKITQRTLVLEHKQLTEYVGNYSYYREKVREAQEAAEKVAAEGQGSSPAHEKEAAPAARKAEPAPAVKAPAKAPAYGQAAKLEKIEMKIAELEATIKMYEVQMNMPQNQTDADAMMELTKEYEAAQAQLDEAYEKWEALSES